MKAFIDAILERFNSDKTLKRYARRIHTGLGASPIKGTPYANLAVSGPSAELDSFDADFEQFDVEFTLFGKDSIPDNLHRALTEMMRVFDDCDLVSGEFSTVQFMRTGGEQPAVVEGIYQASLTYDAIIQMTALEPTTRGV